jgi:uncharacterized protein (DUF58 family)
MRRLVRADNAGKARVSGRQIYILPTAYGLLYAVLLVLMLVGSINYANNLGFLLTFLLAGLGIVAMLHTWRNLVGVVLESGHTADIFAGEQARFQILLRNLRRWPRPGLQLTTSDDIQATDLSPEGAEHLELSTPGRSRGRLQLPKITLSTRYPLGLFRAWSYVELPMQCLVYPAPADKPLTIAAPSYRHSQIGDRGVGADDFTGQRHYRPGDSPRHINWKAMAREQGLLTKLFGGDRAERRWLDWAALQGGQEQRLSQLCRAVLDASGEEIEYGLKIPGTTIRPARGVAHRNHCLAQLALFGEEKGVAAA